MCVGGDGNGLSDSSVYGVGVRPPTISMLEKALGDLPYEPVLFAHRNGNRIGL